MDAAIPETKQYRIVIVGGGFGGLKLAGKLAKDNSIQVVLLDKNNYHQFQPLLYQVATSGLEPSAISFPFRKAFQHVNNIHIRIAEVLSVQLEDKYCLTSIGRIHYDALVIATGTTTNFFGNKQIEQFAMPMKSVLEAMDIRNSLLENYEQALNTIDTKEKEGLMNVVVVGGGPTGVEVSGALAEMKRYILPKDYPELDFSAMQICLLEASPRLLNGMSEIASAKALSYLQQLGVKVRVGVVVKDYDGNQVYLADGTSIVSKTLLWAAGVTGRRIEGFPVEAWTLANRMIVDAFNRLQGHEDVFAIGDIAFQASTEYPKGHAQVAQVAIQQATLLADNITAMRQQKALKPFRYKDLGSMATVGRNRAVVDLPGIKFQGFFAWFFWMFVHLMSLVGVKNRLLVFINWTSNYLTYDQSLRLIFRPKYRRNG